MKTAQEKAISKFMAARKRALHKNNTKYPKFVNGMSTYDYVLAFQDLNSGGYETRKWQMRFDCLNYFDPAPFLSGPEVIEESEQ